MGLRRPPSCEQFSLNSRLNAHCDGAAMVPLCKLSKRGAVRANDLPLSNDLEAWPDSSVGRALDVQSRRVASLNPAQVGYFLVLSLFISIYVYIYIYIYDN